LKMMNKITTFIGRLPGLTGVRQTAAQRGQRRWSEGAKVVMAILLASLLLATVIACSGSGQPTTEVNAASTNTPISTPTPKHTNTPTPEPTSTPTPKPTDTPTPEPTETPTPKSTNTPTPEPTETPTPESTDTPTPEPTKVVAPPLINADILKKDGEGQLGYVGPLKIIGIEGSTVEIEIEGVRYSLDIPSNLFETGNVTIIGDNGVTRLTNWNDIPVGEEWGDSLIIFTGNGDLDYVGFGR